MLHGFDRCRCPVNSSHNLLRLHSLLAQNWRVAVTRLHLGLGHSSNSPLELRWNSLVILADEVGRRDILVSRTSDRRCLDSVRLWNKPGFPEFCFGLGKLAVEGTSAIFDEESPVYLSF